MKILFTFTGAWDKGLNEEGPIMTAHAAVLPDLTIIFTTSADPKDKYFQNALKTKEALESNGYRNKYNFAGSIEIQNLKIKRPNDHNGILNELRNFNNEFKKTHGNDQHHILLTPGTAQIHSCWLLLAASGEIPATLIQTNQPGQGNALEIVDYKSDDFPRIQVDFSHLDQVKPEGNGLTQYLNSKNIAGNERIYKELKLEQIAKLGYPVLIQGETGSGKENLAKAIHDFSNRGHKSFVSVNCGAIPAALAESELFGHKKGAFTGADSDRKGKIEEANKGTLFLDEIGDLSLDNQVKLLRVLQEGTFTRVGDNKEVKVDVRIVAASHKNLTQEAQAKNFREDLYYRLTAFTLRMPPLRERLPDEFMAIADTLLKQISKKIGESAGGIYNKSLSTEAHNKLRSEYHFPGNIREMENILVKSCLVSESDIIEAKDIELPSPLTDDIIYPNPLKGFDLKEWEKEMKLRIYQSAYEIGGSYANAGKILNVSTPGVRQYLLKDKKG